MNKKIILFDWDDTLSSKKLYKENLLTNLARICETSMEEAVILDNQYFESLEKSGDFNIEDYLVFFEKRFNKIIDQKDFDTDKVGIYSKTLFPETVEVLEKLKNDYVLGIYSQGYENLQRLKIKFSGIENYFDQNLIFIDRDKTQPEFVAKLPTGVMVVDDKKEVIEVLRKMRLDLDLVWINRQNDEHFDGALTIKSLEELS